jgi:ACS family pantothenate transporter-like MFS transporter
VYGPLAMSWANEICSSDAEERALVLGIMNASGYAFNAWLPLLTYPARDAPKFRKGFIWTTCASAAQIGMVGIVAWLWRWERRRSSVVVEEEPALAEVAEI